VNFRGIRWNEHDKGMTYEVVPIPEDMMEEAPEYREKLLEAVAEFDDTLMEKYFEDPASISEDEIEQIADELQDRFGSPPTSVQNLYLLMRIKCQLRRLGIRAAVASRSGVSLTFDDQTPVDPQKMVESIKRYPAHYQLSPDGKLLIKRPANATQTLDVVRGVEGALAQLESWCS
jgi:transcription-repair coupling factor (superfamily II helicase)